MGALVGAPRRHVDGHVADQPDPALGRIGAKRAPLALESHLRRDRAAPGEPLPVADPKRVALTESRLLLAPHRSSGVGEEPRPRGERR